MQTIRGDQVTQSKADRNNMKEERPSFSSLLVTLHTKRGVKASLQKQLLNAYFIPICAYLAESLRKVGHFSGYEDKSFPWSKKYYQSFHCHNLIN